MLMHIKTNGATDLVINLSTENVRYIQDMIRMVENNVTGVKCGYDTIEEVKLDSSIVVGKEIVFETPSYSSSTEPTLVITAGPDADIVKNYEALPVTQYLSIKEQLKKLDSERKKAKEENEYLKATIARLEEKINDLEYSECYSSDSE